MSIIRRINETKSLLNATEINSSIGIRNLLDESINSQNKNVCSVLIDQTQNIFATAGLWTNENSIKSSNGIKELPNKKKNNENLIDFSSDSIEKSGTYLEPKIITKIKKNASNSSLSASQSADKSSKLSERSKFKTLKYYLLDSSNKFECFVSHVVSPFLFFIQYKDIFYIKEKFEKKIK